MENGQRGEGNLGFAGRRSCGTLRLSLWGVGRMEATDDGRVVLVHDWLTGMRGGEKCLEVACRRWPGAPLYALLHRPGSVSPIIENRPLHLSWLQRFPQVHRYYRYLLPFMPAASASWKVSPCDLMLSL